MIYGFFCLWFYAVICRNHDNNNVGNFRTSGTHRCKCFVSWGIDKCDISSVFLDHIRTHMLRDTACFATYDA